MLQERVKMNSNLLRLTATFMHILSDQVGRTIDRSVALFKLQLPTRWARRSWSPRTFWPRRSPGRSADRSTERTPINSTSTATTCSPWWPWCFSVFHHLTKIDPLMMRGPFRGHRGCFEAPIMHKKGLVVLDWSVCLTAQGRSSLERAGRKQASRPQSSVLIG